MQGEVAMFLSPHADDAELGCGGYIARLIEQQVSVIVVLMGVRDTSMLHHWNAEVKAEERQKEFIASMKVLGVENYSTLFFNHPTDLCMMDRAEVIARLDTLMEAYKVSCLFLPAPSFHQEHRFTYDCGIAAGRPTKFGTRLNRVLVYEAPGSYWGVPPSDGGYMYADITRHLDHKLEALRQHKSQMYREGQSLISFEAVHTLARYRGLECGVHYAERFLLLRGFM